MQDSSSENNVNSSGEQKNPFQLNFDSIKSKGEAAAKEVDGEEGGNRQESFVSQESPVPQESPASQKSPIPQESATPAQEVPAQEVSPQVPPPKPEHSPALGPVVTPVSPTVSTPAPHPVSRKKGLRRQKTEEYFEEFAETPRFTFRVVFLCLALGITLGYAYWHTIVDLVHTWSTVTDYHHGFLVVPLVIYFLWVRRDTLPRNIPLWDKILGVILGIAILVGCSLARYQFMVYSMVSLDAWTILLWLFGVCLMFFGIRVFLWAAPSLIFLAFMFPWPDSIEIMLRRELQGVAAKMSATILRLLGEHAIAINHTVWLDNIQLDVAAACSGIRILVSVIAAAYAVTLLMRRAWWQNVLLFCVVIPVALMVNALRVATTGLLIKYASGTIEGFGFKNPVPMVADEIAGNFMLVLAFFLFILIVYYIGKVFQQVTLEDE